MADIINQVINAVASHAMASGHFDSVNQHEPKSAPGNGISCSIWTQELRPASSGLTATSVRFGLAVRLYYAMLDEPQDDIDPNLYAAAWDLFTAYSADLDLGIDGVRMVDLLGSSGDPMFGESGYVTIGQTMFRVMTITVGVIVNDAFNQARSS